MPVALVAVGLALLALLLYRPTAPLAPSSPLNCIEFDRRAQVTPDGRGGAWVSVRYNITYECYQSLRLQSCGNFTLSFQFAYPDGSKSDTYPFTTNLSAHPGPGYVFEGSTRFHFSDPPPELSLSVTDRRCNR